MNEKKNLDVVELSKYDLTNILYCIEKAYPCVVTGGAPSTFIKLHDKVSKLLNK